MNRTRCSAICVFALACVLAPGAHATTIVSTFGDSATRGYPYPVGDPQGYPQNLENRLNATFGPGSFDVSNRGVDGLTSPELLSFLPGWLAADNPDVALLMIGGNDFIAAAAGGQLTGPDAVAAIFNQTRDNVQTAINMITGHVNPDGSSPLLIVSAFIPNRIFSVAVPGSPVRTGSEYISDYNDLLSATLTGYDAYFTDNFTDLYDPVSRNAFQNLMFDPIHPNAAGYDLMAGNWAEQVSLLVPEPGSAALLVGLLVVGLRRR